MADLQPVMEKPQKKVKTPKVPKACRPKRKETNVIRPDEADDMAVESMIHDMLAEGKPSSFLLDFVRRLRERKNAPSAPQHAGERWMVEDDLRLRELFIEGAPVAQIAQELNRTQGSIRARLKKLRLVE